jgi:hypothetical protein
MPIKCTKWPKYIPNGYIIHQHFPFQGPPKFTQVGILGLKIYHLATLLLVSTVKKPAIFLSTHPPQSGDD